MNERGLMTKEVEKDIGAWKPLRDFRALPLADIFGEFFGPINEVHTTQPKIWMPRVDVQESEKEYKLTVALPGVRREDVRIDVQGDVLNIIGERQCDKEEKGKNWLRRETSYGVFQRSFILPNGLHPEDVRAAHKDGVLTVTMRKPAEFKPKGVRINVD